VSILDENRSAAKAPEEARRQALLDKGFEGTKGKFVEEKQGALIRPPCFRAAKRLGFDLASDPVKERKTRQNQETCCRFGNRISPQGKAGFKGPVYIV